MKTIIQIRRTNLDLLKNEAGSQAKLARKLNKSLKQVNQWFGKGTSRNISDKTCRELERSFGKPEGWMDTDHEEQSQSVRGFAGRINSRREELGLSVLEVHQRLLNYDWPGEISPPELQVVGAWFSGDARPIDMNYKNALFTALELEIESASESPPTEPTTGASQAILSRAESMTAAQQAAVLTFMDLIQSQKK